MTDRDVSDQETPQVNENMDAARPPSRVRLARELAERLEDIKGEMEALEVADHWTENERLHLAYAVGHVGTAQNWLYDAASDAEASMAR